MISHMFGIEDKEGNLKNLTLGTSFSFEYLKKLIKKYPNDQDLGKYIRGIVQKQDGKDKKNT